MVATHTLACPFTRPVAPSVSGATIQTAFLIIDALCHTEESLYTLVHITQFYRTMH